MSSTRASVSRAWRRGVAVASASFSITVVAWPTGWQSPAYTGVFDLVPQWVFAGVWGYVALAFTIDLARPSWLTDPARVAAATSWAVTCAIFAASIAYTTFVARSTSAFGSSVMWGLVSWLSLEHVRRFQR